MSESHLYPNENYPEIGYDYPDAECCDCGHMLSHHDDCDTHACLLCNCVQFNEGLEE